MPENSTGTGGYWERPDFHNQLKPPNQDVIWLRDLLYGRDRYDWIFEGRHNPANERFFQSVSDRKGRWLRPDWRQIVEPPDPYARRPLWSDPTREWLVMPPEVEPLPPFIDYRLWSPDLLMELMFLDGKIVSHILQVTAQPSDMKAASRFHNCLKLFFREVYLVNSEATECSYACPDQESHDRKAIRFFDNYVERVAGCLLNNFQVEPDLWFTALINASELERNYGLLVSPEIKPKSKFKKPPRPLPPSPPGAAQ